MKYLNLIALAAFAVFMAANTLLYSGLRLLVDGHWNFQIIISGFVCKLSSGGEFPTVAVSFALIKLCFLFGFHYASKVWKNDLVKYAYVLVAGTFALSLFGGISAFMRHVLDIDITNYFFSERSMYFLSGLLFGSQFYVLPVLFGLLGNLLLVTLLLKERGMRAVGMFYASMILGIVLPLLFFFLLYGR
jgi:hypothetical protein